MHFVFEYIFSGYTPMKHMFMHISASKIGFFPQFGFNRNRKENIDTEHDEVY